MQLSWMSRPLELLDVEGMTVASAFRNAALFRWCKNGLKAETLNVIQLWIRLVALCNKATSRFQSLFYHDHWWSTLTVRSKTLFSIEIYGYLQQMDFGTATHVKDRHCVAW